VRVAAFATSIVFLFLVGCESERSQPSASDFQAERTKLNERVAQRKAKKNSAQSAPVQVASGVGQVQGEKTNFGGNSIGFTYEMIGKRDPFRSYEWERLELVNNARGPLEQFDVSQLSVVAVIWDTGRAKAMIQDPGGQSYIVGMGTRVGKNDGSVTSIDDNLVVVKETYEDYLGQVTKRDIEMRIRRPDKGGLDVGIY
jgi:Tfp pilus assembly protein PilP